MFDKTASAHDRAPLTPVQAKREPATPLTVLLVDDNRSFITAVRQFLDHLPGVHIVGQAYDGKSALTLVREHHPALVLLDIAMPGMNGLELARAILQDDAPPHLVFLSIHDNREYRAAAAELRAEFVSKADFVSQLLPLLGARLSATQGQVAPLVHGDAIWEPAK